MAAAISRISCEAKVVVCPGGGLLLGHYRLHLNCGGGGRLWVRLFFLKEAEDEGLRGSSLTDLGGGALSGN